MTAANTPRVALPREAIVEQLRHQLRFLAKSGHEYDHGDPEEAKRMSVALRIIFHHRHNSKALLTQLGATGIRLLSTATTPSPTSRFWAGITDMRMQLSGEDFEYFPKLRASQVRRLVRFEAWWKSEAVYRLGSGLVVTREQVTLLVADQGGGARVDPSIDPVLHKLVYEGAGWAVHLPSDDGSEKTIHFRDAANAAIRQIAYEVLASDEILKLTI